MADFNTLSIITPSFNQGRFIKRTIESILGQGYPRLEYIVMDGGSTDETVDILKSYGDRIIWQSAPDRGQSHAINRGLHRATGAIVAYLNSDDTYVDRSLFVINDFFNQFPEVRWAYGRCRIVDEHDREIRQWLTAYKHFWGRRYSYRKLLSINFINQPAVFWRRAAWRECGPFREDLHLVMDYEYWLRLGQRYPAGVIPAALANFRVYPDSKSFQRYRQQFQDELRVARQYAGGRAAVLLHYLNYLSIIAGYRVVQRLAKQ